MKTSTRLFMSTIALAVLLAFLLGCETEQKSQTDAHQTSIKTFWLNGTAGRLFVDDGGSGNTPVVIVHSLAGNTTQWAPQLAHLRRSRRALAFDMRGHGQSDPALNGDYSLAAMATDLSTVVDSLGLQKFILLGHSYGGGVIATYAGEHSERVAGLLFVDAISDMRSTPHEQVEQFLNAIRSEAYPNIIEGHWHNILMYADSVVTQAVLASLHHTPQTVIAGALESAFTYDPISSLKNYRGPMHTIVSGLPDDSTGLQYIIPNLTHVAMPNTSHWLQMDQPEQFNKLMDEFLNRVEGRK